MAEEKKAKTTVYISEDSLWKMRQKAAALRISTDTASFEAAIDAWLAQDTEPAPHVPYDSAEQYHRKLAAVLGSGVNDAIVAVQKNLDVFYNYVRLPMANSEAVKEPDKKKTA